MPFFCNQNHANQREEHKKLLSFALCKKRSVIRHDGNKLTMKLCTANRGVFEATELLIGVGTCTPQLLKTGEKYQDCQKINLMSSVCKRSCNNESHSQLDSQDLLVNFSHVTSVQRKAGTLVNMSASRKKHLLSADYI